MKTIKVAEATGAALDWLVESLEIARMRAEGECVKEWWVKQKQSDPSPYSTDWLRVGEIIEREKIAVWFSKVDWKSQMRDTSAKMHGPTPLIAAMRCYVASKLGDIVEIPEELG